jgi:microcompartment protein CcmL/EutN
VAFSQADIDAIKAAIGAGVKRVSYSDRTVEYHTLAEMMNALALMEAEVSQSTEGRSTFASFRRD